MSNVADVWFWKMAVGVEWEGGSKKEITKYISYTQYVW